MPTDVTIVANAILAVLRGVVDEMAGNAPDIGGWRETVAAKMPGIAGQCAKAAVDALNAAHGTNVIPTIGVPPMGDTPAMPIPAPPTTTVSNILQEVLGFLQVGCGVIAEAGPITALISAVPYGTLATGIANMVCEAVIASKSSGRKLSTTGPTVVTVKGVRIPVVASPFAK
jgi:hypothetical protein